MYSASDGEGLKRACIIWPRRSGKDLTALSYTIKSMFERVGNYYYYLPTAEWGRDVIWDNTTKDGIPFLDFFPKEYIVGSDKNRMQIRLKNGSKFKVLGSDKAEKIGTNPVGVVFSEFAAGQSSMMWDLIRPILMENDGWAVFIYTPRGMNHGHELYRMAEENDKWFDELLTADDVFDHDGNRVITDEMIEEEIEQGMSQNLVQQEFYCNFDQGLEGSYYSDLINTAKKEGRIGDFPFTKGYPVHTAWDIGVHDSTVIWYFQMVEKEINVINYYENNSKGVEHYKGQLQKNQLEYFYLYGKHLAPHDAKKTEFGSGITIAKSAENFGIGFEILPREQNILDGIEATRWLIEHCNIDKRKCKVGIRHLEMYKKKWNKTLGRFSDKPLHDKAADASDGFRILARGLHKTRVGRMSVDDVKNLEAKHADIC